MKTIAIDIDDVLSSCFDAFIKYHNLKYNTDLTREKATMPAEYWGYWPVVLNKLLGVPQEEGLRRFLEFLNDDAHMCQQDISQDARLAVASLGERYNLEVITARETYMLDKTVDWINKELPGTFSALHFIDKENKTKAKICEEIGAEYLIDDSVIHCNEAAKSGVKTILFGEYGWNMTQHVHPDIIRAKNWVEVLEYFKHEDY